jgi:hypothetical protein
MPTITEEQLDEAFRFSQAYPDDPQVQEKANRIGEAYVTQEVEKQKALRSMYQDRERHGWDDETYNRVSSALSTRPQGKFEVINERFFANTYGLSSDQVRTMQKDLLEAYSTKTWGEPVTDDRAFYDRMGEEMDREDEVFDKGQQLALEGASGFEADAAFDFEYGADPKLKARADTLREQFRKAYDKTSKDISSLGVSVDDYVEELQISMGVKEEKGREPLPDSWFIENVLNMPRDKRDVFLSAVAARSGEGEEKSLLRASLEGLGRQATTMGRSIGNFERINLLSTLRDSVASGRIGSEDLPEEYGFDPKVPLAQAFNPAKGFDALKSAPKQGTPEFQALSEDQQNALVRIDKELEYITLYEKVNALAEGRIDPAKGSNWYTSGVIGASRMVPNIAMMAAGPIGAILNIQNYAGQRATDFLIENPGSDPTDATRIGLATGLAQGLLDAIPTKIIQGKIPFLSSWLKKATLTRGGLFARGAVRLGVGTVFEAGQEFSQDVLAPGVVDEIAQVLKKDLPDANWDKRLEAFKSPETMSELIPSIVMLSLIGTGVGGIKDYRGGWMLASNRRLLIGAGIDPEAADAIVAAAKQQDATTTQTLLRESFAKIDAGPVLEVLPKAQKAAFASLAQEIEDKRTAVFNLEKAGVIPQVVPTKEGFEVTNPKGVKRTFATREEAQTARWEYVAEQEIEVHEDLARVIDRLDRGIRPDQRKDRQLDPETKTLLDAKQEGQRTAEGAKARADKAAFLDDQGAPAPQQQAAPDAESDLDIDAEYKEAVDTAILSSLDEDDRLAGMLIIGESSTAYRDRVYRTTVKLRNRATWATVIEEDSEGDAATMIQKGKRDWLADKLFAFDSDFQQGRLIGGKKLSLFEDGVTRETATDEDLIEAYSRMAQYYFVGTMKKGRQDGFKASEGFRSRYATAVRAGLSPIFDPLARLYRSIAIRATRLEKMRRENRLDSELERELARSVGMTEQIEYEQEVTQEKEKILDEIDPDRVLEDPPKEKTFSVIQDDVVRPVGKKALTYQLLKSPWMEQAETPVVDPTLLDYDALHYKVTGPARKLLEAAVAGGHVDRAAERLVQETRAMLEYPDVASGSGWYGRMRVKLKKALGADHELFTHLLGTTSAQTPVELNFQYAVEALVLFRDGKYDKQIQKYLEFLNFENIKEARRAMEQKRIVSKDETLSEAGLAQRWVEHYKLLPRRKNGGLYGSNSYPTLKALAGVWIKEKMTPKTPQFAMNLYGSNLQATIDVWAARTLRRILWGDVVQKWRILPEHETGVTEEDFALGQMVFARAAKTLGMSPDDLQAIVWFGEKHIWEDRGWTGEIGALKSSFDEVSEVFFPEGAPARELQLGKNIVRYIQKQRLFLGDLLSEGEFNALDPASKEYKKQAKNRKKHEDDYQQALKLKGVGDYLKSGGRDLVREFRTGGAPGQAASPESVDGATSGGSDGRGGEQGTGSSFSVLSNAESRIADSFNPYFRSPEKRRKILLEAQFRSREKARDFQDIILAGKTASQLDQEQIALKKSIYDDLLIQYFGADSKTKVDALPALDRIAARDEAKRQAEQWRTMQDRQQRTIPRETLIAAMRTLDAMIVALPTEIRGKIGGMVRLATLTEPGAMVAELERRAKRLDDVLEDYLSKEADKEVKKLFKLARPAKDESGKAKVGKAGADIHDLFDMARRAWKTMSSTDAEAHAQGLEAAVGSGNLTPEEEAHKLLEAELVRSFGGWNDRYTDSGKKDKNGRPIMTKVEDGADAVRKNHALDVATDIWKRGYHDYKVKKVAEKQQRDLMRAELRIATGKSGARPERVKAEEAGLKWKGAAKEKFFSILNFEQLVTWIFGPSPSAQWFIEQQRTAENKKIDAVQDVVDGVEDLFTKLAGGRFEGEKLQYRMMQRSIKAKSATGSIEPLSEMEAISALLMWMQEDGKRHMMGLRDDTGKLTTGWSYDQNFIDEISKQMTTEGWKVLSYLIAEYRKEYDTLNPIYREIYGINMPRNANYSPLTVKPGQAKQGQTIDPTTGSTVSSGSFTPGSLRTRAQVSAEPDFRDAIATFLSHKKQIEHWKAHAVFIRDAQGVLGNRELGNSVEASSGPEAVLILRKWLDVIAQGGPRDAATGTALMRLFDRMTGRAASMALVGRAGTVMIQATQLGAASAAMPTGAYLARLSRLMTGNLGWSKALNSEYIQRRLKSAPVAVRLAMDGLRSGSPTRTKHAVREIGKILSGADALFTAGTFAIVHDYTKSQAMKAGMSESDADTFALQEAERITENLAQPTRMGTRSYFEVTTTNPIYKLAWSFGSDARKNFALLGYTMAKGTPAEKARALLFVVGVNGILSGLIRNIWRDMRDDEDEEVFDAKYWSLRRLALAASTDWLFGFPIVGEEIQGAIYSALGEQRLDSGLFSAISQAPGAFKNLVIDWDSEDVLRDFEKIVMAAGLFNDQIAAAASVLHIIRDVFDLSSNIIPD